MKAFAVSSLALLLSVTATSLRAQQSASLTEESCRQFVQRFYDWYVPIAVKGHTGPASDIALRRRSAVFAPDLYRRLKRESEIEAKSDDAGLDFDPFLNSQDPSPQFRVIKVDLKANVCLAEVNGFLQGKKAEEVTPELTFSEGEWMFVNFHYTQSDLLQLLHSLRRAASK
jgi:hypothetical protein